MKLLLDTHVFLWWLSSPDQLTADVIEAIGDPANQIYVSVITLWEISIKRAIGKLHAPVDLRTVVAKAGFVTLPLAVEHILASELLPLFHRDPFDRALIAQAQQEGATLITRDSQFAKYDVPLIPA